jgi:hypothetical protein
MKKGNNSEKLAGRDEALNGMIICESYKRTKLQYRISISNFAFLQYFDKMARNGMSQNYPFF